MRTVLKNLSCLLAFLLIAQVVVGQGWERTFSSPFWGRDIAIADNGDVVGIAHENTTLVNYWNRSSKIFRYNEFGQRVFIHDTGRAFNGNFVRFHAICKGNDNGFLAAGINYVDVDSFTQVQEHQSYLVKFNETGQFLWEKSFASVSQPMHFEDIQPTDDGYIITGDVTTGNGVDFKVFLLKLDNGGNWVWRKEYGRLGRGRNIHVEPNGDILVTGNDLVSNSSDFVLLKTDREGNEIWKYDNNRSDIHYGLAVTSTADGGYLAAGHTRNIDGNNSGNFLFKFDSNGDTLWTRTLGGSLHLGNDINDIEENADGTIWLLCHLEGKGVLRKIDTLGNELFRNDIGGRVLQFERVPSGGFYIVGYKNSTIFLLKTDADGNTVTNHISGSYSIDNGNCSIDSVDIGWPNQVVEIEKGNQINYARTDINGQFEIRVDTGSYLVKASPPNDYWQLCEDSILIDFDNFFLRDTAAFLINKKIDCPYLTVNVSAPILRRCFENIIHVKYCNDGTALAENAYIDFVLDDRLMATSSTLPWVSQVDNTFRFEVGDLDVRDCGSFQITTTMDCDSVQLGQTLCMGAHIFPDSICTPIDSLTWDGSDLALKATCDGDSVKFEVINNGNAMTRSVDFIIIEDDMVMRQGSIPALPTAEKIKESVLAEGATYRMEVEQTEGHPWTSKVTTFIEACGTNAIGTFTTGFATTMPPSDNAPFFDTECVEVRGAYDPNDKEGFPKGVCNRRFVFNDTGLEYKIRFQNTGTDTAFRVEIRDTLSQLLDPTTLQIVNASHAYDWDISGNGVLVFTFENIMLPDSNVNEAASHGFIQYKIKQQADNLIDAEIENKAAIYFDFNAPIITNTTLHTVGDDFLTNQLGDLTIAGKITRPCGTPVDSVLVYLSDNCFTYTNEQGDYIFENIEENQDYVIRAERDDPVPKYLNVLDMIRLRNILLNLPSVPSFYDLYVSDVNGSGSTSSIDIVGLSKVVLGVTDVFPNGRAPWVFFNKEYHPTTNPISDDVKISLSNLTDNSFENNFIATKQGDLVSEKDFGNSTDTTFVKMDTSEISVCGRQVVIELDVINPSQISAGQFSLKWDDAVLKYNNDLSFPQFSFSTDGIGNFIFLHSANPDSTDEDLKIQLVFDVVGNVGDETLIEWDEDGIETLFLDGNENLTPYKFEDAKVKITSVTTMRVNATFSPPTTSNSMDGNIDASFVIGGSGRYEYSWSNGETTSIISDLSPGEYTVTITDLSNGCVVISTIVLSPLTITNGVFGNQNLQIKIAPNPTQNGKQASVQIKSNYLQNGRIEITDALGRLIHSKQFETRALEEIIQLESDWPPGIYLVSAFLNKEGMKTIKWVVE